MRIDNFIRNKRSLLFLPALLWILGVCGEANLHAQAAQDLAPQFSKKQIEGLVAPIALYPDLLLAQVLAASTYPLDVVNAARFIQANPDSKVLDQQGWDASVVAVAHYPDVLKMMNDKLEWTQSLGQAFLGQKKDVMTAIQSLRKQAKKKGNLKSDSQQKVVEKDGKIEILPSQTEMLYVPRYNPEVIYIERDVPYLAYSPGFVIGPWLNLGFDWWGWGFYYWRPYYWGTWGYPNYWYRPYGHYYPYYYPYHGTPWVHNPYYGHPYSGRSGQSSPWHSVPRNLPPGRDYPSSRPFTGGFDRPHTSSPNVFGGTGNRSTTTIDSWRGSQSGGKGGFGGFGGYRGTPRTFSPSGGGYQFPKGTGGFNSNWNRSFHGSGSNVYHGSGSSGFHGSSGNVFRGGGSSTGFRGGSSGFHGSGGGSHGGGWGGGHGGGRSR